MRLYRLIGKSDDDYGWAEYHGDQPLNLSGLWRPATGAERIAHQTFKARFSYVDLLGIVLVVTTMIWLDLPTWSLIPLTIPAVLLVLFLEKRFR